jgi:hypothetical protein
MAYVLSSFLRLLSSRRVLSRGILETGTDESFLMLFLPVQYIQQGRLKVYREYMQRQILSRCTSTLHSAAVQQF